MKTKANNTSKKGNEVVMSKEEQYKANLAKALGKKPTEVKPVPVPVEKAPRAVVQAENFGRNPFTKVVKSAPAQAEAIISAEVKKSKKDSAVDTLSDGTPIETVYVNGAGKWIPEPKDKKGAVSPLEMSRIQAKKEADEIAAAKAKLIPIKGTSPKPAASPAPTKKLKDMNEKERAAYYAALSAKALAAKRLKNTQAEVEALEEAPVAEVTLLTRRFAIPKGMAEKIVKDTPKSTPVAPKKVSGNKPLSQMTLAELLEIKGTDVVSDIQWMKYAKKVGYVAGKSAVAPVVKKEEKIEPTAKPKMTRKPKAEVVEPIEEVNEAQAVSFKAKVSEKKSNPISYAFNISEVTLDDLLAELKRRGCKGSIHVCTEFEL
jgi:hypothetical protein